MITLEQLITEGLDYGKRIVLGGEEISPVLTFATAHPDGVHKQVIVPIPQYAMNRGEHKGALREVMRIILKEGDAYCYAFICEAWMGFVSAKKRKDLDPDYRPSEDPERIEAITVCGADIRGRKLMRVVEIKRTPNANTKFKVKFEEFETPAGLVEAESPFLDLLPKQTMQ